jgi:predicted alpha/beta-fold hydrolase
MSRPVLNDLDPRTGSLHGAPSFEPHPWLRSGHAQTIAGRYLANGDQRISAAPHRITLPDSDRLFVLESVPPGWTQGDPAAVLVHGLAGDASAPYVIRLARRLLTMGVRVVRMNLRGAGEGFGLARKIYHGGRSEDLREVVEWLAARISGSPIALGGFSLGANLTLKLAGEAADDPVTGLDCFVAANPPIDLSACARAIQRRDNRLYDWNFVRWLKVQVERLHRRFPELGPVDLKPVRSVYEFDDCYTAPRNGFASAEDYYSRSGALPLIPQIQLPGLVVHAADDPFIPPDPFAQARFPSMVEFQMTKQGGHLGYVSKHRWNGDRRWLDSRLAGWLASRWELPIRRLDPASSSTAWTRANLGVANRHA